MKVIETLASCVTLVPQLWYKCDNSLGTSVTIAVVQV